MIFPGECRDRNAQARFPYKSPGYGSSRAGAGRVVVWPQTLPLSPRPPYYSPAVLVFAVVSVETEHAVELFVRREDADVP